MTTVAARLQTLLADNGYKFKPRFHKYTGEVTSLTLLPLSLKVSVDIQTEGGGVTIDRKKEGLRGCSGPISDAEILRWLKKVA